MMKPQDLMVGDLISMGGVIRVVTGIHDKETENGVDLITTMIPGHTFPDSNLSFQASYCYPIPITQEFLEKNGFVKDKEEDTLGTTYHILIPTGYEANSYTIQITLYTEPICGVSVLLKIWGRIPPYNGGINDIHLCGAKYVHELQHALRLCGIDKEIDLC